MSSEFRGWHRTGSEALIRACHADNPAIVLQLVEEGTEATRSAIAAASNSRELVASQSLLQALEDIGSIATNHPDEM